MLAQATSRYFEGHEDRRLLLLVQCVVIAVEEMSRYYERPPIIHLGRNKMHAVLQDPHEEIDVQNAPAGVVTVNHATNTNGRPLEMC